MNKVPVYEGVACVEIWSAHGARWWYTAGAMRYSPVLVDELSDMHVTWITQLGAERLVAHVPGIEPWLAINVARSDVATLQRRGRWKADFPSPPFDRIEYSPWPAYTGGRRAEASAARLPQP